MYHPDKQRHANNSSTNDDGACYAKQKLEEIQRAHEILSDDSTRLLYHKYGLVSGPGSSRHACVLLTGASAVVNGVSDDMGEAQRQLMRLTGFDMDAQQQQQYGSAGAGAGVSVSQQQLHRQRIMFLAADLVETIRPLVEGSLSEQQMMHVVAQQCDMLKQLPLGSQILRCIGRAYRHAGRRVLKRYHRLQQLSPRRRGPPVGMPVASILDITDNVLHDKLRNAKDLFTAAVASTRLVLTEQASKRRKQQQLRQEQNASSTDGFIGYHMHDELDTSDDFLFSDNEEDSIHGLLTGDDRQDREAIKVEDAMLEALQIEALWKISKIDLDRTIQEACNLIMDGKYFFFPTHQSPDRSMRNRRADGWVGATGNVIDADVGRIRAAAALVLIGDTFVNCSKEGTSWGK